MILAIPKNEFQERQQKFFGILAEKNCDAAVVFAVTDIFYLTGFHFHPTERPIGLFIDPNHKVHLFLPALEHEQLEEYGVVDYVHSYPEYPGIKHPMEYLKELLNQYGFEDKTVGYDAIG
jgi:Xaa-Pro dipeptidase